jgi:hypothetical protein
MIRRHSLGAKVLYAVGGLWIADVTCGHCSGCNLHPWGKAAPVIDAGQAIALAPAVGTAFAPGDIRVEMAERVGNPTNRTVALMPDRSLGLAQALIRVEVLTGALGGKVFGILPQKSNTVLQDGVEVRIATRPGGTVGDLWKSHGLAQV